MPGLLQIKACAVSAVLGIMLTSVAAALAAKTVDAQMQAILDARPAAVSAQAPLHATPCVNGFASIYPCFNIDLLSFVPISTFAATSTSSLHGWTDSTTGIEYALVAADNGTAFFNLAEPDHPVYLGKLPTHTGRSPWRDIRVYADTAYVVSDQNGVHGMQVFDLTRLRGVTTPQTFTENARVGDFERAHTISINQSTGFAYLAGSETCPAPSATGALRMYDIQTPATPVFVGCINTGGYTHESQCWTYTGPDVAHQGKEICINANGRSERVAIVDVTNKAAPVALSTTPYVGSKYTHQGWLTEDQRYYLLNDELDESTFGHGARTYVFDVADLDAPVLVGYHESPLHVIDHNLYVHGEYVYESDYEAGLRILRIGNLSQAELIEVAYFDTFPASNTAQFNGNWGNYRFPSSGHVIATGIDEGLFVLEPHLCVPPAAPTGLVAAASGEHQIQVSWNAPARVGAVWRLERAQGSCSGPFTTIADDLNSPNYTDNSASGQVSYGYRVVEKGSGIACASEVSSCVIAQTTGSCTAAPVFSGLASTANAGSANCRMDLGWPAAAPACGASATYSVYRSSSSGFTPAPANRIASGLAGLTFSDSNVDGSAASYYVVRATDSVSGAEDTNRVTLSARPTGPLVEGTFTSGAEVGDPPFDTIVGSSGGLESGSGVLHAGWHTSLNHVHTGAQSFWSTEANNLCVSLVSPTLHLTAGQSPQFSFWSAWDIELGYDGGVVELSSNNGLSWSRLTPTIGYPSTLVHGGSRCGIDQGSPAFTGLGHYSFSPFQIDLTAYAGQDVQLHWMYRTDTGTTAGGWFVDDIAVTHTQIPGLCTVLVDAIFKNGFD